MDSVALSLNLATKSQLHELGSSLSQQEITWAETMPYMSQVLYETTWHLFLWQSKILNWLLSSILTTFFCKKGVPASFFIQLYFPCYSAMSRESCGMFYKLSPSSGACWSSKWILNKHINFGDQCYQYLCSMNLYSTTLLEQFSYIGRTLSIMVYNWVVLHNCYRWHFLLLILLVLIWLKKEESLPTFYLKP